MDKQNEFTWFLNQTPKTVPFQVLNSNGVCVVGVIRFFENLMKVMAFFYRKINVLMIYRPIFFLPIISRYS
jgi:hypothetical protein